LSKKRVGSVNLIYPPAGFLCPIPGLGPVLHGMEMWDRCKAVYALPVIRHDEVHILFRIEAGCIRQ